jgi:hypothetical protein
MPSHYLKLQNLRRRAVADELLATREALRGTRPTHPSVPNVYALRLLEVDDDHGTRDGLVVQGDGVTWSMIDALYDLAVRGMRAHRDQTGHGGGSGCTTCDQFHQVWSVQVADRIRDRRGLEFGTELLATSDIKPEVASARVTP